MGTSVPSEIWISPTLASKSTKRATNDVLFVNEIIHYTAVSTLRNALLEYGEHKPECKSNERYPSPPCDCGLSKIVQDSK